MNLIDSYIEYVANIRRYSRRTQDIYYDVLSSFHRHVSEVEFNIDWVTGSNIKEVLNTDKIRDYEVYLINDRKLNPRSVCLHISVLSGFCRFLMKKKIMTDNPARNISRPKTEKNLPVFYRHDNMAKYLAESEIFASDTIGMSPETFIGAYLKFREKPGYSQERDRTLATMTKLAEKPQKFEEWMYGKRLDRLIVSILYSTGIRRGELISLTRESVDLNRRQIKGKGKGDKTREIPAITSLCKEISLYLQAVDTTDCIIRGADSPLLVTYCGKALYPVYIDRAVKRELGATRLFTSRKSPHVLRHTLATELLNDGADINSIKELLGHASLAATQIYTHNSVAKLKKVYKNAHPRAKSGGRHGD